MKAIIITLLTVLVLLLLLIFLIVFAKPVIWIPSLIFILVLFVLILGGKALFKLVGL